jgi:hypothetical protein
MDDTDFDLLCEGLSAEEAKRMRKILVEWCDGDENGFPVQLGLLTRAQWRAAARVPRLVNESRKLMESLLTDSRRQTSALVKNFADTIDGKNKQLKAVVETHAEATQQATSTISIRLNEVDEFARMIRRSLEKGISEFDKTRMSLNEERQKLEKVCKEMDERLELRGVLWTGFGLLGAFGVGLFIGWKVLH